MNKVLGIDPGLDRIGFAILDASKNEVLFSECFSPPRSLGDLRIKEVVKRMEEILKKYSPDEIAMEDLFFSKNIKTAMMISKVMGALTYQIQLSATPLFTYTPIQIKLATTGHGVAKKEQVQQMVEKLVKINKEIEIDDEADAIAVAITHINTRKL